jgi:hypothetical protein
MLKQTMPKQIYCSIREKENSGMCESVVRRVLVRVKIFFIVRSLFIFTIGYEVISSMDEIVPSNSRTLYCVSVKRPPASTGILLETSNGDLIELRE